MINPDDTVKELQAEIMSKDEQIARIQDSWDRVRIVLLGVEQQLDNMTNHAKEMECELDKAIDETRRIAQQGLRIEGERNALIEVVRILSGKEQEA